MTGIQELAFRGQGSSPRIRQQSKQMSRAVSRPRWPVWLIMAYVAPAISDRYRWVANRDDSVEMWLSRGHEGWALMVAQSGEIHRLLFCDPGRHQRWDRGSLEYPEHVRAAERHPFRRGVERAWISGHRREGAVARNVGVEIDGLAM